MSDDSIRRIPGKESGRRSLAPLVVAALLLAGCVAQGPGTVPEDRFNYTEAISESSTRQMLTNIVRLRYNRFPTFVSVTSVITNYRYRGDVGVTAQGGLDSSPVDGAGSFVGGSANLGYSERPTITYTPLSGEGFTQRMVRPIPIDALASLGQSGWPVDLLMLTTVSRINRVENLPFSPVPPPGGGNAEQRSREQVARFREFKRVIELFLVLFDAKVLEVQSRSEEKDARELIFSRSIPEAYRPLAAEFRERLDLAPSVHRFRITSRATDRREDEISIATRSLMATMLFLSKGVEVPEGDLSAGNVFPVSTDPENPDDPLVPMRIRNSETAPEGAFAAIQYRGRWFYVDESDLESKRMFTLLMFLFELQAPAGGGAAPLITLPTG